MMLSLKNLVLQVAYLCVELCTIILILRCICLDILLTGLRCSRLLGGHLHSLVIRSLCRLFDKG